jgi:RimJ/RimL family protein N-acetyltransferase
LTARTARGQQQAAWKAATRIATIRRVSDRRRIFEVLNRSPAFNAYSLAYLEADLFTQASFYLAESGQTSAILMHARGGLGTTAHAFGDPRLAGALVALHPGTRGALLTCQPEHVDTMLEAYNLWRPQTMLRMRVDRASFKPPANRGPVRRLLAADAPELNRLYALEGDGIFYGGRHIREGMYFGALSRGRIVAAAGTHIYSKDAGVAVVGNVFTHPDFRGHGLATAATAAVTAELLGTCGLVVLSVDPANRSARYIYDALGYQETGRIVEAMATRRRPYSPLPLARRLMASRRSGEKGAEVVKL